MVKNHLKNLISESGSSPKSNQFVLVIHPIYTPSFVRISLQLVEISCSQTENQTDRWTDRQGWKHNLCPPLVAEVMNTYHHSIVIQTHALSYNCELSILYVPLCDCDAGHLYLECKHMGTSYDCHLSTYTIMWLMYAHLPSYDCDLSTGTTIWLWCRPHVQSSDYDVCTPAIMWL